MPRVIDDAVLLARIAQVVRAQQREANRRHDMANRRRGIAKVRGWIMTDHQNRARWYSIYHQRQALVFMTHPYYRSFAEKQVSGAIRAIESINRKIVRHERDVARYEAELFAIEHPERHDHSFACF